MRITWSSHPNERMFHLDSGPVPCDCMRIRRHEGAGVWSREARERSNTMSKVKETTYTGMLGDWQRSLNTFAANAADLSHLETSRAKLEGIFQKAQEVAAHQAALTAS